MDPLDMISTKLRQDVHKIVGSDERMYSVQIAL
jgi:hypothetical protein